MAPDTGPAVALSGVRRSFGDVVAVDDLTFEVPRGTVTVLLGPNGAGKTTVVRLVTGALPRHGGAVRTFGLDPDVDDAGHRGAPALRRGARPAPRSTTACPAPTTSRTRPSSSRSTPPLHRRAHRRGRRALRHRRRAPTEVGGYSTGMRARLALAARRAARARPPAARRADRGPRPRVGPRGARPHRRDGRGRQDRPHVHAPAARGRRARRPGGRDGPRPGVVVGLARELTQRFWPAARVRARRRRPRAARHRAGACRSCAPTSATASRRSTSTTRATSPTSSTRSSAPARGSRGSSRRRRASKSSTSRSAGSTTSSRRRPPVSPRPSWVIARTDLRQLRQARDFWLPLDDRRAALLRDHPGVPAAHPRVGEGRQPGATAQRRRRQPPQGPAGERAGREGPGAGVVRAGRLPLRTARDHRAAHGLVGGRRAHDHRRARARQRRVPRPLPRHRAPDLPRQADGQPHPRLLHRGDGLPPLLARREPDRRPEARRLVLPHHELVDPHALGAAAVHRARARGDPRHLGPRVERGRRAAGVGAGDAAADRHRLRRVEQHAVRGAGARVRHRRPRVVRRDLRVVARLEGRLRASASSAWAP